MWIVGLLAGIAILVAVAWKASRHRYTSPTTDAGGTDTFFAGEGIAGPDYTAPDGSAGGGGGCDGGGGGGD
jgi:hypothetical protein